ncbi:hypothetical protein [uncultured Clostridium sp.]|uniref:hypothetical protein n=1 Tax=uncultured Clostridium sp. TaxID=59620 RepID=UPI0028E2A4FB|nr:hypothetical protein [uncultured Clostridium sp.]
MNELNCKFIQEEDLKVYSDILSRFKMLNDNDYAEAFRLHQEALMAYERWSYIFYEIRTSEKRGIPKDVPLKDRIKHMLDIVEWIYTSSRTVFVKGKNDLNSKGY